jgi:hypothetical protein
MGSCRGKGSDEQTLLRSILDTLEAGNILLGDAFYATYFLLCALQAKGVDGAFEQQGSRRRSTDCCIIHDMNSWRSMIILDQHESFMGEWGNVK